MASRIDSTNILNNAVLGCTNPPKHWLNSSTATIYRHSTDKQMDEATGETGSDFSMTVAKEWEKAFYAAATPYTRKTALRTSIVLGSGGGAYIPLRRLAKLGLGGRQGNGRQFVSWIHELDFARAVEFILKNEMEGVVNVVSPTPVRNVEFMKLLRHGLHMPFGLPAPEPLLRLGAKLLGTEPELVLKSRNVIPKRLQDCGFTFDYTTLKEALQSL